MEDLDVIKAVTRPGVTIQHLTNVYRHLLGTRNLLPWGERGSGESIFCWFGVEPAFVDGKRFNVEIRVEQVPRYLAERYEMKDWSPLAELLESPLADIAEVVP